MKKFIAVNAGIAALMGSGLAEAGYSPYYVGAAIGKTHNNTNETQFCPECEESQFTISKTNGGISKVHKVYGGANLTSTFAVEAEYANLGETYSLDMYRPENGIPGGRAEFASARQKTRGIGISAKANHRLTRKTSVFGKAGAFVWENKNSMDYINLDNVHEIYKTTEHGVSPTLGIGVEQELGNNWSVRVGWDRYFNTGKGNQFLHLDTNKNYADLRSVKTDTNMIYVGATFNF
ncbi:outer membrane beta-barrel protein [Candidatus Thiothrix sp. Deng01]|uniref:Outer membrane beta-barrel protein n=1 Tax=Candidatus Thiothrix phosphatis TaxID=3112415 RepID=A0ABU6D4M7_9GAMM|nr:outer membrane beta-barrel protein [Candidatus Thiothrix sp. Deng01]MEB4593618.1 outer membrane beta-barrel protein [Candidatus Thiothrix sp. Deng01]